MENQITMDFTNPIPHIENNVESQHFYEANADKFNNQCKTVYEALLRGERLTVLESAIKYGIGHLPRRILDLKNLGVNVLDERMKGGYKEYFLIQNS